MRLSKWDIVACLGFLGLTLLFFNQFLTGSQVFAFKDLSRYFYPLRYLMVEQVKAGQLPLWNPYIFCGWPLLATLQVCFFYPLTLIYYFLPFNPAFNYYMVLHYFLAACFMYALLRYFRLHLAAAFAGGVIFAFSGYLLSVSNMNTSLSSVIWLPLILLVYDQLMRQRTFLRLAGLGVLLAVQFLGGEPTVIYVTGLFLLTYAAVFSGSVKQFANNILKLGLSGLIALGLVAVQLLPFLELAKHSDRVVRTTYGLVTFRSFPPRELLNFVFPYFFGNPAQFGGFTETLIGRNFQDWLISPYMGILPLYFMLLSFASKRRAVWFFFGAALAALALACGRYTPLYHLFYLLPGISMIRYPVKYLFLMTFCLTILSAFGFDRLLETVERFKQRQQSMARSVLLFAAGLAVIFAAAFVLRQQAFALLAQHYSAALPKYFFELLASMIEFNLLSLFFIVVYFLALGLLLLMVSLDKIKINLFAGLVLLLIAADLMANGYAITVPVDASVFAQTPPNYKILLNEPGLYRFFYTPELEKENRLIWGEDYNDALAETHDNLTANWHIPAHLFDFFGYESIKPYGLLRFYRDGFKTDKIKHNMDLLSYYNVKYIGANQPLNLPSLRLLRHKKKYGLEVYLYKNVDALPRAYILYGNKGPEWAWTRVKVVKYTANEVVLSAKLKQPGRVFLSDADYTGWQAGVDGQPAAIKRAKGYFRSVALEPGLHKVRFLYAPWTFKLGALISSLTIIGLLAGGWINFKKTR